MNSLGTGGNVFVAVKATSSEGNSSSGVTTFVGFPNLPRPPLQYQELIPQKLLHTHIGTSLQEAHWTFTSEFTRNGWQCVRSSEGNSSSGVTTFVGFPNLPRPPLQYPELIPQKTDTLVSSPARHLMHLRYITGPASTADVRSRLHWDSLAKLDVVHSSTKPVSSSR